MGISLEEKGRHPSANRGEWQHELTDAQLEALMKHRGGCRCQDPGARPPCGVCTDPCTVEEAEELEFDPPAPAIDRFMKATRDLCR